MERVGNWLLGLGALLLFVGLCIMAAALGDRSETAISGLGILNFSLGSLFIGLAMYLKARDLQHKSGEVVKAPEPGRRMRGGCDLCGTEAPVVQCKVHQLHLCGTCLAQHYDVRSCTYAPSHRKVTAKAMAAKVRG